MVCQNRKTHKKGKKKQKQQAFAFPLCLPSPPLEKSRGKKRLGSITAAQSGAAPEGAHTAGGGTPLARAAGAVKDHSPPDGGLTPPPSVRSHNPRNDENVLLFLKQNTSRFGP